MTNDDKQKILEDEVKAAEQMITFNTKQVEEWRNRLAVRKESLGRFMEERKAVMQVKKTNSKGEK